jgi:leucyl aminopeptidase
MKITFSNLHLPANEVVVFTIAQDLTFTSKLKAFDDGSIAKALKADKSFTGKKGEVIKIAAPQGSKAEIIFLVGLGEASKINHLTAQEVGGKIAAALNTIKATKAEVVVEKPAGSPIAPNELAVSVAGGLRLRNYAFNQYFVAKKEKHALHLEEVNILVDGHSKATDEFEKQEKVLEGVILARDLTSEPPNKLYPETFAARCRELESLGVKVEIFKERDLQKLGMGAFLGVGQGSANEAHMVIMRWEGDSANTEPPLAFVGKGITFDTGGINLKPTQGIADMKYDMAGAATVTGLMYALASRKAKVNVVGAIGLAENMPSGTAQRPSDVVTTMSGQTVEVDNTDAEGRLVLADVLWYVQDRFSPKFMVDLATLTGAIVIALGDGYAGLFSNNDELAGRLIKSGEKTGDRVWRMPMGDHYDKQIDSEIADIKNTGSGRGAGSATAAQFLQRFVNNIPWAHLDIAGMAWNKQGSAIQPKGATGFGVALLNQLVADFYEE